ncbi:sterol O-acyltransferase 2 [Aureobasidium pullulans]|nr:sterol O-acyltransferase 2 [Aureobasidium pullulans]
MASLIDTAITTSHEVPTDRPEKLVLQRLGTVETKRTEKSGAQPPKKYRHTFAVHSTTRASCLSQDSVAPTSFTGFRNLGALVIIVSNLRLMIENFKKYGVLICVRCHDYRRQDVVYGSILYFLVPCHLFVAYIIELVAAQQAKGALARAKKTGVDAAANSSQRRQELRAFRTAWHLIAFAHGVNATLNLALATYVVYYHIHHPGIGTLCELHAVIVWLKTCSYAFTNRDLRHALLYPYASEVPELYSSCPYPQNITLHNLTYFWWAPTLIYQPVYPRSEKIRWPFVFKRCVEVIGLSIVIWIASAQYAAPLLRNSLGTISSLDLPSFAERLMKLSTISLFCWLAGFYALFQSFLNALAEVMRFGDRER